MARRTRKPPTTLSEVVARHSPPSTPDVELVDHVRSLLRGFEASELLERAGFDVVSSETYEGGLQLLVVRRTA